jgi:tRNA threonylcarbamoyladenosine biosynthesis protein TsaE
MFVHYKLKELESIAESILSEFSMYKIFCFEGDLGAGKTTLIEAMCRELGSEDELSSPTFSIINEYNSPTNPIYHMDWYRLKSVDEAYNIGIEDYLFSGNYCFIEWYQHAEAMIPRPYILISIKTVEETSRELTAIQID